MIRNWSIPAGRLFGIDVRIHLTFFLLLAVIMTTVAVSGGNVARALALTVLVFLSVLLHEFGHALVGNHFGHPARSITLLPIGGVTVSEPAVTGRPPAPGHDIAIALAGPIVNLILGGVALAIVLTFIPEAQVWAQPWMIASNLPRSFVWANLSLAAFNLLPAYPMDGGRVLRALFATRMDYRRATRWATSIGQVFATVFIIIGLWNLWLMVIGFFLFVGAQLEERSVMFQSVLESVRMEEVMLTDFATLSPADTLEDALSKAVHSLQDDFPVVRGNDLVGVISRQNIQEALRGDGNAYVQSVMTRAFEIAQKGESLGSALRKLTSRGLTLIPVVDGGLMVGIVTLQNIMHNIGLLAEKKRLAGQARAE
jgi:Zn-dependent protease/CBS domain-containing protein